MEIVQSQSQTQSTEVDIQSRFEEFRAQIAEWKDKAFAIVVTDENQTAEIKQCAEGRKFVSSIRISIEKRRKELKEKPLREGQMIDAAAGALADEIEPIEAHLKAQEKFVEIQAKKRHTALQNERAALIQPYYPAGDARMINWADMVPEAFEMTLKGYKEAHANRLAEQERMKAEQEARAKAEAEERERIKAENERLKRENDERDKKAAAERLEAEAKLRQEREAREKLEREAREREAREEAERKAKAAADRKAKRAPDRVKLLFWIEQFEAIPDPKVKDEEAQRIVARAQAAIGELLAKIKKVAEDL